MRWHLALLAVRWHLGRLAVSEPLIVLSPDELRALIADAVRSAVDDALEARRPRRRKRERVDPSPRRTLSESERVQALKLARELGFEVVRR